MSSEIKIKKSTIFGIVGILFIATFVFFALRNVLAEKNNEITGELVKGAQFAQNKKVFNDGGVQTVSLGVANYNYDPLTINVELGKPVRIIGDMEQLKGCLRAFTIPGLGIFKNFKDNDNILEFTPTQKGTFSFSCSMGMGYGTLIVK